MGRLFFLLESGCFNGEVKLEREGGGGLGA